MRRVRAVLGLAFALALCVVGASAWLATRPPTIDCQSRGIVSDQPVIPVRSVFVKPWFGPHHVYGLFLVPDRLGRERVTATLRVGDFQKRTDLQRTRKRNGDTDPLHGYYVKRIYVPTRVALRFLLAGRFGDLRTPCNWTLTTELVS